MSKSKYGMERRLFEEKYKPFLDEFRQHDDDRLLVANMADQLVEACEAMEDMENVFVRVAFDNAVDEQDKKMERIVTRFTGKVWNGFRWQDEEVD